MGGSDWRLAFQVKGIVDIDIKHNVANAIDLKTSCLMSAMLNGGEGCSNIARAAMEMASMDGLWGISIAGNPVFRRANEVRLPRFLIDADDFDLFGSWVEEAIRVNDRAMVEVNFITTRTDHVIAKVSALRALFHCRARKDN